MKILVMAAGALGGYFGALLSKHNDVILISRGENLKAIEKNGLEIQSDKSGNFTRKVKCLITPPTNYHADLKLSFKAVFTGVRFLCANQSQCWEALLQTRRLSCSWAALKSFFF